MSQTETNTQNETVLNHLRTVGNISGMEAQGMYRIRSLSSRISELKKKGYNIVSERKVDPTGQRYVRYRLISKTKKKKG